MSIKVQGIYVLTNGSWRKVEKVFKDGAWREAAGIFHNGNWYEIDAGPYITVTPTGCRFEYNATLYELSTDRFTLISKGAWTISTSWSSGYSNWCGIRTLNNLPISSGSAGTYNLKASCDIWSPAPLNEIRRCTFTFSSNGNTARYVITQGRLGL